MQAEGRHAVVSPDGRGDSSREFSADQITPRPRRTARRWGVTVQQRSTATLCTRVDAAGRIRMRDPLKRLIRKRLPVTTDQKVGAPGAGTDGLRYSRKVQQPSRTTGDSGGRPGTVLLAARIIFSNVGSSCLQDGMQKVRGSNPLSSHVSEAQRNISILKMIFDLLHDSKKARIRIL